MSIVIPRYTHQNACNVLKDLPDQINLLGFWSWENNGGYDYNLHLCIPGVGKSNGLPYFQFSLSAGFLEAFADWARQMKIKHNQFISGHLKAAGAVTLTGKGKDFTVKSNYQWPDISKMDSSSGCREVFPYRNSLDLFLGPSDRQVSMGYLYFPQDFTSIVKFILEIERIDALIQGKSPEYVTALTLMPSGYLPGRAEEGYTVL